MYSVMGSVQMLVLSIWVQFTSRLFFETKNQSLIWKRWDILGHMVWMLCINTSTVVWITPTSPNMSCNPSGLVLLLSFHYGCRKLKPGFCFNYECYAWLQFRINLLYLFRTNRFWVWLVAGTMRLFVYMRTGISVLKFRRTSLFRWSTYDAFI